jgi:flagellin-specific chaperone FliS
MLALALLFPLASAYAESFTVTTNKDLYTVGEKAIIVGIIPDSAPDGYAVLVRVTGSEGDECAAQNVLPDSDNSFVSRPLDLEECGAGQYLVLAYYAELSTNSTFIVSNSSKTAPGNKLELRLLKNVAVQAQETVNQKLREFLESSQVLPEDIADKYSLGVFEASLVLQALDFGDTAEAKKHLIFTINHFREVLDALSAERMIFEAVAVDAASDDSDEAMLERYERLKEFYFRLEGVAQKNGIDKESEFGTIVSLLARSKQLIEEDNLQQAGENLERANEMLESIRRGLYGDDLASTQANATSPEEDLQAMRLAKVADKFEKDAYELIKDGSSSRVNATIQQVLDLISQARLDIESGDYASVRSNLSAAFSALDDAREMIKDDRDNKGDRGGSDDSSANGSDDEDSGPSDSANESNSGSNGNDENDQ